MSDRIDCWEIPIFLISYNRLMYLSKLVAWLERAGYKNIHILDNASTYPPLLAYLKESRHQVHRLCKNYGHLAVWECNLFSSMLNTGLYVVSDCDILPIETCPPDLIAHLYTVLRQYQAYTKVGLSLKTDDLPDCYVLKEKVIAWERQFWQTRISDGLWDAIIDTTFALYKPGIFPNDPKWWKSIRTDFPYTARHLPWYQDSNRLSEEEINYQKTLDTKDSDWSLTDTAKLKEQNMQLKGEIHALREELLSLRALHRKPGRLIRAALRRCARHLRLLDRAK